jgi:hypothetical protein
MSQAGFAEFARQSILVWRREAMAGLDDNKLTIKTHGFKRAACWNLDIDETTWNIKVESTELVQRDQALDQREKNKTQIIWAFTRICG